jgi:hypothetical protein
MAIDTPAVHFFGDLSDPWVVAIADALPTDTKRDDCPASLPEETPTATILVVHRALLGANDGNILRKWREHGPHIILCVGPNVRARDVEPLGKSVDVILNDATASEIVARYVGSLGHFHASAPRETLPLLAVVASGFEMRRMLVDAAKAAGFPARGFSTWDEATPSRLAIWDAPVMLPGWEKQLIDPSRKRTVLAMIGFPDRYSVALARDAGAAACLDFPCDIADLAFVLDRLSAHESSSLLIDGPHAVPPTPRVGFRVVRPPVADRRDKR